MSTKFDEWRDITSASLLLCKPFTPQCGQPSTSDTFVSALPSRTLIYSLNFLFVKPSSQICNQILHLCVPNLGDQQLRLVAVGTSQTGRNITKCCRALMGPAVNLTMTYRILKIAVFLTTMTMPIHTPESAALAVIVYSALCDDYEVTISKSLYHTNCPSPALLTPMSIFLRCQ